MASMMTLMKVDPLEQVRERVANGVALLDERRPGWADKIDEDEFEMGSCFHCVVGQLFGKYQDGLDALNLPCGILHGFDVNDRCSYGYDDLMPLWLDAIQGRRTATTERAES